MHKETATKLVRRVESLGVPCHDVSGGTILAPEDGPLLQVEVALYLHRTSELERLFPDHLRVMTARAMEGRLSDTRPFWHVDVLCLIAPCFHGINGDVLNRLVAIHKVDVLTETGLGVGGQTARGLGGGDGSELFIVLQHGGS